MSEISNLAATFQRKSQKQAESIEQELRSEFQRHAESLRDSLSGALSTTVSDIQEQQRLMRRFVLRSWVWLGLTILLLLVLSSSLMWWAGSMIQRDIQTILEQRQTIEKLGAAGYEYWPAKGSEPAYLVLPKGLMFSQPYTSKAGTLVIKIGTKKQLESK